MASDVPDQDGADGNAVAPKEVARSIFRYVRPSDAEVDDPARYARRLNLTVGGLLLVVDFIILILLAMAIFKVNAQAFHNLASLELEGKEGGMIATAAVMTFGTGAEFIVCPRVCRYVGRLWKDIDD